MNWSDREWYLDQFIVLGLDYDAVVVRSARDLEIVARRLRQTHGVGERAQVPEHSVVRNLRSEARLLLHRVLVLVGAPVHFTNLHTEVDQCHDDEQGYETPERRSSGA